MRVSRSRVRLRPFYLYLCERWDLWLSLALAVPLQTLRVMYPYQPQNEDELELVPGDFVFMSPVDQSSTSEGWVYGTSLASGLSGLLPENYVSLADESDTWVFHGLVLCLSLWTWHCKVIQWLLRGVGYHFWMERFLWQPLWPQRRTAVSQCRCSPFHSAQNWLFRQNDISVQEYNNYSHCLFSILLTKWFQYNFENFWGSLFFWHSNCFHSKASNCRWSQGVYLAIC